MYWGIRGVEWFPGDPRVVEKVFRGTPKGDRGVQMVSKGISEDFMGVPGDLRRSQGFSGGLRTIAMVFKGISGSFHGRPRSS